MGHFDFALFRSHISFDGSEYSVYADVLWVWVISKHQPLCPVPTGDACFRKPWFQPGGMQYSGWIIKRKSNCPRLFHLTSAMSWCPVPHPAWSTPLKGVLYLVFFPHVHMLIAACVCIFISQGEGFRFASCSDGCARRPVCVYWQNAAGLPPCQSWLSPSWPTRWLRWTALLFLRTKTVLKNIHRVSVSSSSFQT